MDSLAAATAARAAAELGVGFLDLFGEGVDFGANGGDAVVDGLEVEEVGDGWVHVGRDFSMGGG